MRDSAIRAGMLACLVGLAMAGQPTNNVRPRIPQLEPPEKDFFSKSLDSHGIPIEAREVVADEALYVAYDRLALMLTNLPMVTARLAAAGVEVHIIGRDQVTTDLPEWQPDKGKHLAEYNGQTRDERTRGMGGLLASCGEENLLRLEKDRYRGRDILVHEFAHSIRNFGIPKTTVALFDKQYQRSLGKGLWKGSYAGSNPDEFFAELKHVVFRHTRRSEHDRSKTGERPGRAEAI